MLEFLRLLKEGGSFHALKVGRQPAAESLPVAQADLTMVDCSFVKSGPGLLADECQQLGNIPAGMTVAQAYSNLLVDTGTNANDEFLFRSKKSYAGCHLARIQAAMSQRIASQFVVFALADLIGENVPYTVDATGLLITLTLPAGHGFTADNIGQTFYLGGIVGGQGVPGRYSITAVAGNQITVSPVFACTWTRATTTATVTFQGGNPLFALNEAATVSASSDVAAIVNGAVTLLTQTSGGITTFTCLTAGATSGTLTLTMSAKTWAANSSGNCTAYGWNCVTAVKNGTSGTALWIDSQRRGWASGQTTVTVGNDAAPGQILQIYNDGMAETWSDGSGASQTTAATIGGRASREANLPHPDAQLYLFISVHNGVTAPASTTRLTVGFFRLMDVQLARMTIMGFEQGGMRSAADVRVASMPTTSVNATTTSGAPTLNTESSTNLASSATYTGASRDNGSTAAHNFFIARAFADQAGTLAVDHSTDGTTWRQVGTVAITAGQSSELIVRCTTRYHRMRVINGATAQGAFLASSAYHKQ